MIQCVESRDEKNPYCSRVCCAEAVKNALEIKRRVPQAKVIIVGRDIRTNGLREIFFGKRSNRACGLSGKPEGLRRRS